MTIYDVGDGRRLTATFRDINGQLADPTTVTFRMTTPDGATTEYGYGVDAELVRDSLGVYRVDWTVTQPGRHHYRWAGDGDVVVAEETSFTVRETNIL